MTLKYVRTIIQSTYFREWGGKMENYVVTIAREYGSGGRIIAKKLAEKLNACSMPVVICRGNCDSEVDTLVLDMPIQAPYTYVVAEGLKIVTTHGHYVETDEAKDKMAKALKADIFISGHVHINVLEKRGNTVFLNPGSPSLSKREDNRATVAVLEDKTIKIIDIDTDEVIMTLTL